MITNAEAWDPVTGQGVFEPCPDPVTKDDDWWHYCL